MPYNQTSRAIYKAGQQSLSWTEKKIIEYYELEWYMKQRIPTNNQIVEYINKQLEKENKRHRLKHTALSYYQQRGVFKAALNKRGIKNWELSSEGELTPEQKAAAITVCNFADERSTADKLDQLGISTNQYYAWLNDPQFKAFVDSMVEQNKVNIRPAAINELAKKVNAGEWAATKFYLETTGALLEGQETTPTAQLLQFMIEIIQKHVKDGKIIAAIAADMLAVTQNRTPVYELTGEVVEDVELEDAKKQLGIG